MRFQMAKMNNLMKVILHSLLLICIVFAVESQSTEQQDGLSLKYHGMKDDQTVKDIYFSMKDMFLKLLRQGKPIDLILKENAASFSREMEKLERLDGLKKMLRHFNSSSDLLNLVQSNKSKLNGNAMFSNNCRSAMDGLFKLVIEGKYSKIEHLLDAMGKPGSGLLQGNLLWEGSFQECEATDDSHYCMSSIQASSKLTVRLGLCMPKECTEEDTYYFLHGIASSVNKVSHSSLNVVVDPGNAMQKTYGSHVQCKDKMKYSNGSIAALTFTALIGCLVIFSTLLDYLNDCNQSNVYISKSNGFMPHEPVNEANDSALEAQGEQPLLAHNDVKKPGGSILLEIMLCFSLRKNAKAILSTDVPASAITCLNGIRTLSMFWVILGHTFFFGIFSGSDNLVQAFKIVHRFSFQAIANAYFSVDTFFVLSGLLVSYLCLKRFNNYYGVSFSGFFCKKFLPLHYLHRFLRLTPSYMYVILFYVFIYPYCGEGPIWFQYSKSPDLQYCRNYWWTNLLYVNNFYPTELGKEDSSFCASEDGIKSVIPKTVDYILGHIRPFTSYECIGWSWYLANDMQFYIISPIILLIMFKLRLPGTILVNAGICVVSFAVTGAIVGTQNLNSLLTGDFQANSLGAQGGKFGDWIYSKPYCRIPPYLVGLALGYLLYNRKSPRGNTRYVIAFVGWVTAFAVGLAVTYGPYTVFKEGGRPFTNVENVLYGTFSRCAWGLCVAWVVYACHFQMGGVINTVLSWKAFIPLSRLTYSAYLVHPIIIDVYYGSLEKPFHFADVSIAYGFASFILMTYSAAFLLSACIEFPASNLEKLAFRL